MCMAVSYRKWIKAPYTDRDMSKTISLQSQGTGVVSPLHSSSDWCWQQERQGPFMLTRFNFNPGMDKYSHVQWSVVYNYSSIFNLQRLHPWSFGMDRKFHPRQVKFNVIVYFKYEKLFELFAIRQWDFLRFTYGTIRCWAGIYWDQYHNSSWSESLHRQGPCQ